MSSPFHWLLSGFLTTSLFLTAGCGGAVNETTIANRPGSAMVSDSSASLAAPRGTELSSAGGMAGETEGELKVQAPIQSVDTPRKIIYTASVSLVVENFDGLEQRIRETVQQHNGYLSQADLDRMQGEQRSGRWTARVPVDRYESFLQSVVDLGVPTSQEQNAQDVTEEFVDVTARIDNKKRLEQRILELLDRPDDKIQHVIEVERELGRVREEIERMEGRLRYLADQTAMTTVTIAAREERDYQPPQAPTLDNRVRMAWNNSLDNTVRFFQNAVVFVAGNAIAMAAWLVGLVVAWIIIKSIGRRFRRGRPPRTN